MAWCTGTARADMEWRSSEVGRASTKPTRTKRHLGNAGDGVAWMGRQASGRARPGSRRSAGCFPAPAACCC